MEKKIIQFGGFTILTGLGATLVAGLLAWVFNTTLENKITFTPLIASIDKLTKSLEKSDIRNTAEHELIVKKLSSINGRINVNETKLFRVIKDCSDNNSDIRNCQATFKRN